MLKAAYYILEETNSFEYDMSKPINEVISDIRFPMCIAVVCIHSAAYTCPLDQWLTTYVLYLLSDYLPAVAVPCFFLIAGYLSAKRENFKNSSAYVLLLKRRAVSLLLPYVIWNVIAFAISWVVNISPLARFASGNYANFENFPELLKYLFWEPRLVPLWFVRNLILITVASPIVFHATKKVPVVALIAFYLICCCDEAYFISGLFFYGAGMAARLHMTSSCLDTCLRHGMWLLPMFLAYALLSAADAIPPEFCNLIDQPILLAGVIGCISICSQTNASIVKIFRSNGLAFFVYALHGIITPYIIKSVKIFFHPTNGGANLLLFFLTVIASLTFCVAAYAMMFRYAKPALKLLIGSRL